jgi:ATP-binding cassette subfamily B protein
MTMMGAGGRGGGARGMADDSVLRAQIDAAPEVPHLWRRIGGLFVPYRPQLITAIVLVLITAALGVAPALLTQQAFDKGLFPVDGGGPNLVALWWIIGAMVAVLFLNAGITVWQTWLTAKVGNSVTADLRVRLFNRLQQMELAFFAKTKTGEVQSRLQNDVGGVANVLQNTFTSIVGNIVTTIASVTAMFVLSWQLAILSLVLLPPLILLQRRVGQRRARIATKTQQSLANMTAMTQEQLSVSGVLLTKTLGREAAATTEYEEANRYQVRLQLAQAMAGQRFFAFVSVVMALIPVAIYVVTGYLITGGAAITAGTIVAFTSVNGQLRRPLLGLMRTGLDIQTSKALFARIFEYLDLVPEIEDAPGAIPVSQAPGPRGRIEFQDVVFRYPDAAPDTRPTLQGVSFTADPGQHVAFVGPSGAGKTTVLYLAPRLYEAHGGSVLFAGADVRTLTQESIIDDVGIVSQETYLFHATIRENLLYAKPGATEEELIAACQAANIHHIIAGFEHGYDTIVGERGYRLSGGEKQRIAIARVLLKDPPVLLLDEATSALDTVSERVVQEALDEAARGRTVLSIAHRLSTVMGADVIHVLEAGQIVESGTHSELLAAGGLYAELAAQQVAASQILGTEAEIEASVGGGLMAAFADRRADRAPEGSVAEDAVSTLTASVPLLDGDAGDQRVYPAEG